jgi:hypothetical protein
LEKPDYVEPGTGRLAAELAASLDAKLQDALNHPVRREVLRGLNSGGGICTAPRLAERISPISLSRVNYHLQVLVRTEAVTRCEPALSADGVASYQSNLCDEPGTRAVLKATEDWDRAQGRAVLSPGRGRTS